MTDHLIQPDNFATKAVEAYEWRYRHGGKYGCETLWKKASKWRIAGIGSITTLSCARHGHLCLASIVYYQAFGPKLELTYRERNGITRLGHCVVPRDAAATLDIEQLECTFDFVKRELRAKVRLVGKCAPKLIETTVYPFELLYTAGLETPATHEDVVPFLMAGGYNIYDESWKNKHN
jgi:hypothetical protein